MLILGLLVLIVFVAGIWSQLQENAERDKDKDDD